MDVINRNQQFQMQREALPNSPYRGLLPYDENDAPFFHGRQAETQLVIANLYATRLTLFYGESGTGKSSVLRAGVLHTLKSDSESLGIYFNKWKGNCCANLKLAAAEAASGIAEPSLTINRDLPLDEYLPLLSRVLKRRLFIILDQFEEYFLYHEDGEDDEFAREFPSAVRTREAPLGFLISLREDRLSLLDRFEADIPTLFDNYLRIKHLDVEGARAAIVQPVIVYNEQLPADIPRANYEPELVNLVLNELSRKSQEGDASDIGLNDSLNKDPRIKAPYLQLVMTRLWAQAARTPPPTMRVTTLNKLGGVGKIIDRHLDKSLRGLSWSQRRLASQLFLFLVTPSGTKRAYTCDELAAITGTSPRKVEKLMGRLSDADTRILNAFEIQPPGLLNAPQNRNQNMNYEIYHDFLAQPILAWRARQRLYQRFLIIQLFWALPAFIVAWSLAILPSKLTGLSDLVFRVIIWTIIFSIPLTIGFLIGRALERTR